MAGLAHALQGDHLVGKYCCLLCPKEFSSESGVKYHILKTHAEVGWAGGLAGPGADGLTPQRGMGQGGSGRVVACVAFEGAAKVRRAGGFPRERLLASLEEQRSLGALPPCPARAVRFTWVPCRSAA